MGLFNSIKSFVIDNKNKIQNINEQPVNNNSSGFNSPNNNVNNTANQVNPNSNGYIVPNQDYRQHQVNNTEALYQNNNIIRPARMNVQGQQDYYLNGQPFENQPQNFNSHPDLTAPKLAGYVEPYYNHDFSDKFVNSQPPQRILPRRMQQAAYQKPRVGYQREYYDQYSHQPQGSYFQQYGTQHGYFTEDHYVNQYRRPYQRRIANPQGQINLNEMMYEQPYHQPSVLSYQQYNSAPSLANNNYGNYSRSVNPQPYQEYNMANEKMELTLVNSKMPVVNDYYDEDDNLDGTKKNKRYAYQVQLRSKGNTNRLSREHANKLMPLEIAREIKSEKIRTLIMILVGFAGTVTTSIFIALYFISHKQGLDEILGVKKQYIPHPFLTITLLLVSLGSLFAGIFDLSRVKIEANNYLANLNRGNHTIPHFLIDNYKKMTVRSIVLNWIAFPTYFFGGIILGILYGFQQHTGEHFMFGFWSWGIVEDLTAAITITIIILIAMLGIHIANIVLTKKRKSNIIGYYGYEIVKPEELAALKKKTNRICLIIFIIFLIILTLAISIPWLIARRKRHGKGIPFFSRFSNK